MQVCKERGIPIPVKDKKTDRLVMEHPGTRRFLYTLREESVYPVGDIGILPVGYACIAHMK